MTEKSPADTIEAARWEILLMIDIMRIIGNAQVGGSKQIDGTMLVWLADKIGEQSDLIESAEIAQRRKS